jgi:hypothetical protein
MIKRLLCLLCSLGLALPAVAAECTMKPAAIDVRRIAREPAVKSYVIDKNKLALTALFKNGRALRLVHMGCAHSGATASLWFDSTLALSDSEAWSKEFMDLAHIAFSPGVANDIIASLKSGKVTTKRTESSVVMSAAPTEFMNYSIIISSTEQGMLLTMTYSLG